MTAATATAGDLAVGRIEIETDRADLDAIGEAERYQRDAARLATINRQRAVILHPAASGQEVLAGLMMDAFPTADPATIAKVLTFHRNTHSGHRSYMAGVKRALESSNEEAVAVLFEGKA
jgi:hypothetical protein